MTDAPLLVVYGASGHGKVVCDVLLSRGLSVAGFLDDDPATHGTSVLGLPVLGGGAWLAENRARVALGIGANGARARVAATCILHGSILVTAVHRDATVAPSAALGEGTVVMARAVVNPDASVGRGVIVNTGAVVEHDCALGDFAHISPNAALGGAARLGAEAHLGLGAVVLPGVCVGDGAVVGGGAVVVREIPPRVVARGVPARVARPR